MPCTSKEDDRSWADLPIDIRDMIYSRISEGDCIRFRLTCKSWQSVNIPVRNSIPPPIHSEWSRQFPWLMSSNRNCTGKFSFYHPISHETYEMDIPELAGAKFCASKYGWLLMSRRITSDDEYYSMFFFNPFTRHTIKIINFSDHSVHATLHPTRFSYTEPPTSPNCKVFGHQQITEYCMYSRTLYRADDSYWKNKSIYNENTFLLSNCSPVLWEGVFCCLDLNGKLGAFDPENIKRNHAWKPLIETKGAHTLERNSYIAECDGELLSISIGRKGKPISIFKLDQSSADRKWVKVESLGDKAMFISETGCVVVPTKLKGTGNKIYFPRFGVEEGSESWRPHRNRNRTDLLENRGKECFFYSLRTGKYHCFGINSAHEDWRNSEMEEFYTWIEPNVEWNIDEDDYDPLIWYLDEPYEGSDEDEDDDSDEDEEELEENN